MASGAAVRVRTVNCLVKDKESELHFNLTAELAKCDITFTIESSGKEAGSQVGVLEIRNAEKKLERRNESKPFPAKSITKKGEELKTVENSHFYKVKLKKEVKGINLNDYFLIGNR